MSQRIIVSARTSASPADVYALLRDGASWPSWSPVESFALERAGQGEPEGLGAVRVLRLRGPVGMVTNRVRIVELVPERRFGYVVLSGLPVRDYWAGVGLERTADGTEIEWRVSFSVQILGTGPVIGRAVSRFLERSVWGLADYAAVNG